MLRHNPSTISNTNSCKFELTQFGVQAYWYTHTHIYINICTCVYIGEWLWYMISPFRDHYLAVQVYWTIYIVSSVLYKWIMITSKWIMITSSNGNIFLVTGPLGGIQRWPVDSPHKSQWAHYDVTIMGCNAWHHTSQMILLLRITVLRTWNETYPRNYIENGKLYKIIYDYRDIQIC